LQFIGDSQGVDYVVENQKSNKSPLPDFSEIAVAMKRQEKKNKTKEETDTPVITDEQVEEIKGLMARRSK
jgi:hypothetical protein